MEKFPQISTWHLPLWGTTRWLVAQTGRGISIIWLLWRELCLFYTSHLAEKSWAHCLKIALRWDRMKQAADTWAIRAISDGDVRQYRLLVCFTVINVYHLKYNKRPDAQLVSDIYPPGSHCCSFSISHCLSREDKKFCCWFWDPSYVHDIWIHWLVTCPWDGVWLCILCPEITNWEWKGRSKIIK